MDESADDITDDTDGPEEANRVDPAVEPAPADTAPIDEAAVIVIFEGQPETQGDLWRRASTESAHSLLTHTAGMLAEPADMSPKSIHKSRVAIRNFRSHLRTFAPLLRQDDIDPNAMLVGGLKRLASSLGAVRDLDVTDSAVRSLEGPLTQEVGFEDLLYALHGERAAAFERLQHDLAAPWCVWTRRDLVALVNDPPLRTRADKPATKKRARELASRPFDRLARRVAPFESPKSEPSPEELHRIRLAAKAARYCDTALTPVLGTAAQNRADELAQLQDILGGLNDSTGFTPRLAAIGEILEPSTAFLAGRVAAELTSPPSRDDDWRRQWKRCLKDQV